MEIDALCASPERRDLLFFPVRGFLLGYDGIERWREVEEEEAVF